MTRMAMVKPAKVAARAKVIAEMATGANCTSRFDSAPKLWAPWWLLYSGTVLGSPLT